MVGMNARDCDQRAFILKFNAENRFGRHCQEHCRRTAPPLAPVAVSVFVPHAL